MRGPARRVTMTTDSTGILVHAAWYLLLFFSCRYLCRCCRLMGEMVQPADFPKALYASQGILFVAYIAVGAAVYATVGAADWLTSPLSLSLSPSTSRAMAITVHSLVILHVTYVLRGRGVGGRGFRRLLCCLGFVSIFRVCRNFGGLRGMGLFVERGVGGGVGRRAWGTGGDKWGVVDGVLSSR